MTAEGFRFALVTFHAVVLALVVRLGRAWIDPERCRQAPVPWLRALLLDGGRLLGCAALAAAVLPVIAVLPRLERLSKGSASGRLLGEAVFGECVVFIAWLACCHARSRCRGRSACLGTATLLLLAICWDGYYREPRLLIVRHHALDRAPSAQQASSLRILHMTDIQTPVIGAHEEQALRQGMALSPDLVVMTGDYVQDHLGRPTEDQAMRDLRGLMRRVGFGAPLGVYATEGDAGPPCREVFAGTDVQCLIDASVALELPGGDSLGITGLSGRRGRERSPTWLRGLLDRAPPARHRIVISHAPDFVDVLDGSELDLVLAGHTHGGQVVLPLFGPPFTASRLPRRYAGGLHDFQGIPLHVSRGVGMERGFAPQVRFLCPPEICVIDLRLLAKPSETTAIRNGLTF